MNLYTEPNNDRQPDDDLGALRQDVTALLALAHQLGQRIDAALPQPAPATKRDGIDLATIPLKDLVEQLLEQRGARSAAWLRTKLHQKLEQRSGRRLRGGGRDRVTTNGHGGNGRVAVL